MTYWTYHPTRAEAGDVDADVGGAAYADDDADGDVDIKVDV